MRPRRPNARQWLGLEGENRAACYLESRGYRIVARNVRADRVEIDLIAQRGSLLIFVEVKSREVINRAMKNRAMKSGEVESGEASCRDSVIHADAAEAVDERKQRRLRHGAHVWLAAHPTEARRTRDRRFDVVTCLLDRGLAQTETSAPERVRWSIEHWEAAF